MTAADDPATHADHLEGRSGYVHELLAGLSDELLEEQIKYYRHQMAKSSGQDGYHHAKHLSAAVREQHQRP